MSKKVAVVGWYGHQNSGDEAFKSAFQGLWPDVDFWFFDKVPPAVDTAFDAIVFGGGSFLDQPIKSWVTAAGVTIPIGFLGVGIHNRIHPDNVAWLERAKIVVARNVPGVIPVDMVPPHVVGDLLFAREFEVGKLGKRRVTVLGSCYLTPHPGETAVHRSASDWFTNQLAAVLDTYAGNGEHVDFVPMCAPTGPVDEVGLEDDRSFAWHVAARMVHRDKVTISPSWGLGGLVDKIASSSLVISARFHGCVLATILGRPFVGISAHDKVRSFFVDNRFNNWADFYGFNRTAFEAAERRQPTIGVLKELTSREFAGWQSLRDTVEKALGL